MTVVRRTRPSAPRLQYNKMPSKNSHVAIVDDDPTVRRALTRLLRTVGYRVECYASGADLLRLLPDTEVECIVLDIEMPGLNGFEVQRTLVDAGVNIPVIMITGRYNSGIEARATAAGVMACLPKPIDASQLIDALSQHCEA